MAIKIRRPAARRRRRLLVSRKIRVRTRKLGRRRALARPARSAGRRTGRGPLRRKSLGRRLSSRKKQLGRKLAALPQVEPVQEAVPANPAAEYQQGYSETYQEGFNAGFAQGFEDGHKLAYSDPRR